MGYIASRITTIPGQGYDWYLTFIETEFQDDIRNQIDSHFEALGKEAGERILVVRGYDAKQFRQPISEAAALLDSQWQERFEPPALFVTNRPPQEVLASPQQLYHAKVLCFSLGRIFERDGTIVPFLSRLLDTLAKPEAMEALEGEAQSRFSKWWGWLTQYLEMKPGAFGFSVNLGKAIGDLARRR